MSLEALERSDLSRLPGGIFTRSFIRAYAEEVGLDPERMIQDFAAELPQEPGATTTHPGATHASMVRSGVIEDGEKLDSDRKAVATALKLVLASLPILGVVMYYSMHRAPVAARPVVQPVARTAAAVDAGPPSPAPTAPGDSQAATVGAPAPDVPVSTVVAQPQPMVMAMEIAPKSDCWVSVTVDGVQAFSGLMRAGERRQVSAHDEISLNVGDAGAFAYLINGKEGRPLGAPGEVVSRRITLAEAKDYTTP
jgi:cytoskeletal protein RodZ